MAIRWIFLFLFFFGFSGICRADQYFKKFYYVYNGDKYVTIGTRSYSSLSSMKSDTSVVYYTTSDGGVKTGNSEMFVLGSPLDQIPGLFAACISAGVKDIHAYRSGPQPYSVEGVRGFSASGTIPGSNPSGSGDISSLPGGVTPGIGGGGTVTPGAGTGDTAGSSLTLTGNWLTANDYSDGLSALNNADNLRFDSRTIHLDKIYGETQKTSNELVVNTHAIELNTVAIENGFSSFNEMKKVVPSLADISASLNNNNVLLGDLNKKEWSVTVPTPELNVNVQPSIVTVENKTDITPIVSKLNDIDKKLEVSPFIPYPEDESYKNEKVELSSEDDILIKSLSEGVEKAVDSVMGSTWKKVWETVAGRIPSVASRSLLFNVDFNFYNVHYKQTVDLSQYSSLVLVRSCLVFAVYLLGVFSIIKIVKSTLEQ